MFTIDASVYINALNPTEVGSSESQAFLDRVYRQGIPVFSPRYSWWNSPRLWPECSTTPGGALLMLGQSDNSPGRCGFLWMPD